jgi:signal transduction histidine kinase
MSTTIVEDVSAALGSGDEEAALGLVTPDATFEAHGPPVMAAADSERRRLERDLHDGAQQRLVALSVRLRLLASRLAPGSEAEQLLAEARNELAASLQELRDLARGIHPAILSDRGLPVALEALTARAPLPVELHVELRGDQRTPTAAPEGSVK